MALVKNLVGTISEIKTCLKGISKAERQPDKKARKVTCQKVTNLNCVKTPSTKGGNVEKRAIILSNFFLSKKSVRMPDTKVKIIVGNELRKLKIPK